jgi:hypothetical protein
MDTKKYKLIHALLNAQLGRYISCKFIDDDIYITGTVGQYNYTLLLQRDDSLPVQSIKPRPKVNTEA